MTKSIIEHRSRFAAAGRYLRWPALLCVFFAAPPAAAGQDLDTLSAQVRAGDTEAKREALLRLRNLRSAEASRLAVPALRDKSEIVRASAAFSVVFLPPGEAFAALSPNLTDKDELVRRETCYALGKTRHPAAVAPLVRVFQKDKVLEVRNAAIVALGELGDASAVETLTGILRGRPTEENEFTRRAAARSIGQIAQIIQTGESEVLTPEKTPPTDRFYRYKNLAFAVPAFRPALGVLIETLKNPREADDAKREAAFALGAIADASAVSGLRAAQTSADYYLAEISREALKKIDSATPVSD